MNALWILAQVVDFWDVDRQIVSVILIITLLISLFVSPSTTAMGIVMKFYSVVVIAFSLYMLLYKTMQEKLVSYGKFHLQADSHEGVICGFLHRSLHHGLHESRHHLCSIRIAIQPYRDYCRQEDCHYALPLCRFMLHFYHFLLRRIRRLVISCS